MSCTLLLIRHGQTSLNLQGRYQGHIDTELSAEGEAQANWIAEVLGRLPLAAVVSSDLRRAIATASPLAAALSQPVLPDPRLRELHFGAWEGRHWEEVAADQPDLQQAWWADPWRVAPPGGESTEALWHRVRVALTDLGSRYMGTVAVVTHGGPLRLIQGFLTAGAPALAPTAPANGAWLTLPPEELQELMK